MTINICIRGVSALCIGLILSVAAAQASAQAYPAKAIHLVVPYAAGSGTDTLARLIAEKLGNILAQSVIVENQPGANGIPASAAVARAAPDGYTLLTIANNHVINASLYRKLPFDPLKDFTPILRLANAAMVLVAHPSLPVKNLEELIGYAKAQPGKINYASPGNGSNPHLGIELLNTLADIHLVHIPYKGSAQAQSDVVGGHVPIMIMAGTYSIELIRTGRVRALGVTTPTRLPQLPDVRAIAEVVKGFELSPWLGLLGPAGLPRNVVSTLAREITRIMQQPETVERLRGLGVEVALMQAEEFASYMAKDAARLGEVVRHAGVRLD